MKVIGKNSPLRNVKLLESVDEGNKIWMMFWKLSNEVNKFEVDVVQMFSSGLFYQFSKVSAKLNLNLLTEYK